MKGNYLVMDNAPIYTPVKVRDLIESRGYNILLSSTQLKNFGQK